MIPMPMNLLLIGDGSRYIDLSTAQEFQMRDATYYRSQDGILGSLPASARSPTMART